VKLDPTRTVPLDDSTPLLADPAALRAKADRDGVLFFRGLLPADEVRRTESQLMSIIAGAGLVAAGSAPETPRVNLDAYDTLMTGGDYMDTGLSRELYLAIQKCEAFHALAITPRLLDMYRLLFDSPVLAHPRNIARVQIPGTVVNYATPAHQDFIFIQGNPDTWTAWAPLRDTPTSLGGLTVLRGSHKIGVLDYSTALGAGGLEAYICGLDYDWMQGDYEAGDVITFNSQTVHKALPNQTDQIRLSVDYRYQPAHLPLVPASLEPHVEIADWAELYEGWSDNYPKYYWQTEELEFSELDPLIQWQKEHIC
jgi:hypothetical protein